MYQAYKTFFRNITPLSEEEWEEQKSFLQVRTIAKNEFIIREGQIEKGYHFVNYGSFRVFNLVKDKEITTNFFFTGSVATDYWSLIKQKPAFENIQALEDSELITMPFEKASLLYDTGLNYQRFGRLMAEQSFAAIYLRQQELLTLNPKERYLRLINKRPKVIERIPQHFIASYLGITPEYLSRIRREIRKI